ncbi:tlde1 domain-containing protein [Aquitalea pelogenes]|uniref:tlde1 domain-containing protein n=1 Tax=Aquitalea pelogenes TaxID=1293573 RepID=UPI00137B7943|nr:tlde1 domain-containing protein [Aquitalea pelogenes]
MDVYSLRNNHYFMRTLREQARHALHGDTYRFTDQELFDLMKVEEHFREWQRRQASLLFDGEILFWQEAGQERKWTAYSGREGYWSPKFQNLRDKGPIPEGSYLLKQSEFYPWEGTDSFSRLICFTGWLQLKLGKWPGCRTAWGEQRITLIPQAHTNVHGRHGFAIHGGKSPESAGCVDLTNSMDSFAEYFQHYGKDMLLEVRYKHLPDGQGYHRSRLEQN